MSQYQDVIRLSNVWRLMKRRCEVSTSENYYRYGGRGISICDEWQSMDAFIDWALMSGYTPGLELERKDNDGNYGPDNCTWVTRKQQMRNTSANRLLTAWDETKPLAAWVDDPRCVIPLSVLRSRLDKMKWPVEEALTVPSHGQPRKDKGVGRKPLTAFDQTMTIMEWSGDSRCKTSHKNLVLRLSRGWSPERAISTHDRRGAHSR
jgi:hypothetical protein